MFLMVRAILASLLYLGSLAFAECSFSAPTFEGELEVAKVDEDMFPAMLSTSDDSLSQILLDCDEGTVGMLRVLPPEREDSRVPILETKPRSFFIYQGERYGLSEKRKSALVIGRLEDEPVRVGIMVGNGEDALLASDDYRYTVIVQLTIEEEVGEAEADNSLGESTARNIEIILGQEP